ncbi:MULTISPECIES: primosomal protein N' [unclassified Ruminococcus]|uniref:replication restart helicase PriA n=1 Tax=Ruminococcus sp. YE71 TaxID=244362 RepID=UPI001FA6D721|nr:MULTISPECIES: primosomal protein N' [unclassified Ruminococcus]
MLVVEAAVSTASQSFDRRYTYTVPDRLANKVCAGARAFVPFGRGNRKVIALILSVGEVETADSRIKALSEVIDDEPLLGEEMLAMAEWLKETTFCTYFDAFRSMVPNGFSVKAAVHYKPSAVDETECGLTDEETKLLMRLKTAADQRETDSILDTEKCANAAEKKHLRELITSMCDKGALEEIDVFKRLVGDASEKNYRLTEAYISGNIEEKLSAKQKAVVDLLTENTSASASEICYMAGCTNAVIKRLEGKGIVMSYSVEVMRKATADADERLSTEDIHLNDEQTAAYDGIMQLVTAGKPSGALLYGVTGSGKTSVFFKLIASVLALGKTAMLLVPEISLTPQMVKKFKLYFGDDIALLHSSLSLGQRADEFKRIKRGEAKIVIGTRSAVFAPLSNIGIIILDEEGERTYKSDSSPRYHAREAAIQRCGYHKCVMVLASATPSVESFYYAKQGRFHLFEMHQRYANATLPEVEIIDMQTEAAAGNGSLFSRKLADAVGETLEKGEQVILLLNRRGYTTHISCAECRQPLKCPSCDLPLTYHIKNNRLMCHYCGYSIAIPHECPSCHSEKLRQSGAGTQKIEDELGRLFPKARLLRMDADTTFSRYAYEESFSAFERGEYDIMLGTQMIAKGLNFPNVTLVGIVSIDKALFTGDFRSYERTFSLITQVAGRSGRGDKPGRAFIQTFVPDHYVINLAAEQNYDEFYEQESELRHALLYPPFCDICAVNFSSVMESRVIEGSKEFVGIMRNYIAENRLDIPLRVLGPTPCTLGRINNRYRYRLIIKCRVSKKLRDMIRYCTETFRKSAKYSEVRVVCDINGDIGL